MGDRGPPRILLQVKGTVSRAKGLNRTKLVGSYKPYCLVKGIKGNCHLVDFHRTQCGEGRSPQWDEDFFYDCTKNGTLDEFVGLKFIVFDGDDFLGGVDYDLQEVSAYKLTHEELELEGIMKHQVKGKIRKARIFISVTVERGFRKEAEHPRTLMLKSLMTYSRVTAICGRITRCRNLTGKMGRRSAPMCFLRCFMMSGKIVDMYTTGWDKNHVDPCWNETFEFEFEDEDDQPLVLMFDVLGSAGGPRNPRMIWVAGDHLGSGMAPISIIPDEEAFKKNAGRFRLPLVVDSQLYERRLGRDGKQLMPDTKREAMQAAKERMSALRDGLSPSSGMLDTLVDSISNSISMPNFLKTQQVSEDGYVWDNNRHITVELFAERIQLPMPNSEYMRRPIEIEEEDLETMGPDDLIERHFQQGARRVELSGEDRAVVIYGRIARAMDLIGVDWGSKSDPFVVVEAITKTGIAHFMYRTRIVKATLNPVWDETFLFRVPPYPDNPQLVWDISSVNFTIYDADDDLIQTRGGREEFLGRCGVDITSMRSEDSFFEDVPLIGVQAFKPTGGYRRYAVLSVELRIERRVQRIATAKTAADCDLFEVPRHKPSRTSAGAMRGVKDPSQDGASCLTADLDVAQVVTSLRDRDALQKLAAQRKQIAPEKRFVDEPGWFEAPQAPIGEAVRHRSLPSIPLKRVPTRGKDVSRRTDTDARSFRHVAPHGGLETLGQNWKSKLEHEQAHLWSLDHVNQLPPMRRTAASVPPGIVTRFGQRYEDSTEERHRDRLHTPKQRTALPAFPKRPTSRGVIAAFKQSPSFHLHCTRPPTNQALRRRTRSR